MSRGYLSGIISASLIIFGDVWNIVFDVHNRPYTIGYHIVNGHKIFYYSCKVFSDFIFGSWSIGDVLIISGLAGLSILTLLLCRKILLFKAGGENALNGFQFQDLKNIIEGR